MEPDYERVVSEQDSTEERIISMDTAMERLGMGPFQYRLMACLGLFFAADAMQVLQLSFLVVVLGVDWESSHLDIAASSVFVGALVGTLVWGPMADKAGRRPVFLAAASCVSAFGLVASMTSSVLGLTCAIFGVGFGIGGLTIPFDILAEFSPAEGRGGNLLFIQYFWTTGSLFVVLVAYTTLHGDHDRWRLFVALCTLPCFISLVIGYIFVPESARWLSTQERTEEALQILRDAAEENGLDPDVVFPVDTELIPEPHHPEASIRDLLHPRWRKNTLYTWGVWLMFTFGYYGTIMATTEVFSNQADSSRMLLAANANTTDGTEAYGFDYGAIFVSSAAEFLGTTGAILAVDTYGRIPSQVVSYTAGGISVFLLCFFAAARAHKSILLTFGFIARSFEMAATCVTWVATAEIFATEVRGVGHATSNAVARIGAMACPFLINNRSNSLLTIGLVMLFTHSYIVWCVLHLPETNGVDLGGSPSEHEHLDLGDEEDDAEQQGEQI